MSQRKPTDQEVSDLWADECRLARERLAERQRLDDAMRAAGFATPKKELQS
jgi:D-alanyl-D-alanine dipeptidase